MPHGQFESYLGRLERRLMDLEARLDRTERDARDAKDECYRLEGRIRDLEYALARAVEGQ